MKFRKFIQSISLPTSNVFLLFNVKQVYKCFLTWQMTDKVYPTTQDSTQIHIGIGGSRSSNRTRVLCCDIGKWLPFSTIVFYIEYVCSFKSFTKLRIYVNDYFRCKNHIILHTISSHFTKHSTHSMRQSPPEHFKENTATMF